MPAEKTNGASVAMLAHTCYMRDPRVRREAEALAAHGLEVHVISLAEQHGNGSRTPEPRHAVLNGVHIHRLPIRRQRGGALRYFYEYVMVAILGGLALARLHLRSKLRVVHVHNMPDLLVLAAVVPRLGGSMVILDVHDPMPELYMSWKHSPRSLTVSLLRMQEKVSYAFADRIISVNESMRENLQAKGVPPPKISIINNFPDETLFPLREPPSSWPRNRDCLVLLYCGTVSEHYDLGLAVRAMARVAKEIPVKLRILGEGNKLREVLELAATLAVDSVEHVGLVPVDQVRSEMQNADVGLSCHRAGIFGDLYFSTKIVEYLTQGLPVLSPRTHTITKYLSDDCLFYYEPGSDEELADTLRFMWQHPPEVLRRLRQARELLPRLSWHTEKQKLVSFYADLLTNPSLR
jgi:glycosyltransferase involved in cell wall biosynthesis